MAQLSEGERKLKIYLLGSRSTGKTSFVRRYAYSMFKDNYVTTLKLDLVTKSIERAGQSFKLCIYDTPGQENFSLVYAPSLKGTHAAIIAFNSTEPSIEQSMKEVLFWKNQLDANTSFIDGGNIPCLLLGNKCDSKQIKKDYDSQWREFANKNEFFKYGISSAKINYNIDEAFKCLVDEILRREREFNAKQKDRSDKPTLVDRGTQSDVIKAGETKEVKKSGWCCF